MEADDLDMGLDVWWHQSLGWVGSKRSIRLKYHTTAVPKWYLFTPTQFCRTLGRGTMLGK